MAEEANIPSDFFIGEDKIFAFTIYQKTAAGVLTTTPQNIAGWALKWDMRRYDSEADPAVLSKTTGAGTITITDGINGQGQIAIADTDTDSLAQRVYRHSLKRTDDGSETVLFYGNAILKRATVR